MNKGYVRLHRKILDWRWYSNPNTRSVFIHLILTASHKGYSKENLNIKKGSLITSYDKIAEKLSLTNSQVRTALNHLKQTGEISVKRGTHFIIVTIRNYNKYQLDSSIASSKDNNLDDNHISITSQSDDNHISMSSQHTIMINNDKKCYNKYSGRKNFNSNNKNCEGYFPSYDLDEYEKHSIFDE